MKRTQKIKKYLKKNKRRLMIAFNERMAFIDFMLLAVWIIEL